MSHAPRVRSLLIGLAGAFVLAFAGAGTALADSATIGILNTAGQSDPAAGLPRTFQVSGSTAAPQRIYVKYRNPGGAPCAPNADSDSGTTLDGYYGSFWGTSVNGNYNIGKVLTWDSPGPYMFCIWIASSYNSSVTPITQVITFRSPTGTISATLNPVTPAPGQSATVTIVGASEAAENVYATVHSGGVPCSQNYSADYDMTGSSSLEDGTSVNGNFALTYTLTREDAGSYVICLWLADSSNSLTPIAGPQPIPFNVGTPYVAPAPKKVTSACKKAKSSKTKWTKAVQKTKKRLLKARKKKTRKTLTKRLKSQRHSLRIASSNVKLLC
jgi:hypothetical protein